MVIVLKARNENGEKKKTFIMERPWASSNVAAVCVQHFPLLVTVGPAAVRQLILGFLTTPWRGQVREASKKLLVKSQTIIKSIHMTLQV